ncbi:putative bifunctional diguanylate cyclase/phosphodiesterase [Corynebacterium sp. L4756]|uniref:putative bifunctional diguanylate cyclase/phosphodiesterase n=1 Tax=unclassified Corynebacterium TaxID=2624378 RepID=UPI00374DC48D
MEHLAGHDSLTGLVNRRLLESEIDEIVLENERETRDSALLLLDLDYFKEVNDALGHQAGDRVLIEFGEILNDSVRDSDIVGRIGGDEFVIVLPDTDRAGAEAIATRIIEKVNQHFENRGKVLSRVSVSIGVTLFSDARAQGIHPFILADQLLYDAKHAGRNRIAVHKTENTIVQSEKPAFSVEALPEILESDAIRIELQPVLELRTGRIDAAEGLLRINLNGADVPTGQFVQAVEKAGLGPKLDLAVMRMGLGLIEKLRAASPSFRLALNLSAQSLSSDEACQELRAELEARDVPRGAIGIEITETAPIEDVLAAKRFAQMLEEFGFHIAIDDFGAGHEPYRYLKMLDFSVLKIAGEFVEGMVDNRVDRSIVESIIQLAKEQEMETIAEYVSSKEIFEAVRECGATYAQGFYIGKSIPVDEFIATYLETNDTATWE